MSFSQFTKSTLISLNYLVFAAVLQGCEDKTEIVPEKKAVQVRHAIAYAVPVPPPSKVFYGKVQSSKGYEIASFSNGRVESMPVKEGEYVKKGQLLARLYSPSLEAIVLQKKAQLSAAFAASDDARKELKRVTNLHTQNLVPVATLEQAQKVAKVSAESVFEAKASLSQALNQLEDISIYAVEDGLIAKLFAREGQFVSASEPIIRLEETGKQKVLFSIPEQDALNLNVGDTVHVLVRTSSQVLTAKVTEKGIPKISGPALFSVTVELEKSTVQSLGLTAKLIIPLTDSRVYSIAASAVRFTSEGQSYLLDNSLYHYKINLLATRGDKLLISAASLLEGVAFNTAPESTLEKNLMIAKEGEYE
ncbi:hypothetical protein N480_12620 [Pseudoalteromonas luteoviolacea S2607]|uniref:efflux RND transporter periplasmic adaptor subunit n=1 Tax=Pseudoalteromonas luteoviolacea TaxID=43657 RepID=UPI0007B09C9E|nr:efflux RND transporter periplasmic adaptor subunit [Pseudoalteromonas luteoviolacea]KZN38490.1 hypothetical protein N480_12620 [Pseudoalteromonas luteoviolacea S2607]